MRLPRPWYRALAPLLTVLWIGAGPAYPGQGVDRAGGAPQDNTAYVPDDDEGVRKAMAAARKAADGEDWRSVARSLQSVVESPANAVLSIRDRGAYEGAWIVAHHQVVREGAASLAAYEGEFGVRANEALERAVAARDEAGLARVAALWLPTAAGRAAALLLSDAAAERGDGEEALGWLERVEDLADAAGPTLDAEVTVWRAATAARAAAALAADEAAVPRILAWRDAVSREQAGKAPAGTADALRPPDSDFAPRPAPSDWPTAGGGPSRTALPSALGPRLSYAWAAQLRDDAPSLDEAWYGEADSRDGILPSPWIPARAAVWGDRAYVNDGTGLRAIEVSTGRHAFLEPVVLSASSSVRQGADASGNAARTEYWGWTEGHGVTVDGSMAWCAVPSRIRSERPRAKDDPEPPPDPDPPHLAAVRLGEKGGDVVWRAGGVHAAPGLPEHTSLYGSPLLYRGLLWAAGVRGTKTKDQVESWLVALDPKTGAARHALFLGAGGPVRRGRASEALPGSCAGARGRVVVVTNLGIVACADATVGRIAWMFRYDRGRPDGDDPGRRLQTEEIEQGPRHSSFSNEPPLLYDDLVFVAPTDSRRLLALFDRPRGRERNLRSWDRDRVEEFRNLSLEQLVGVVPERSGRRALLVGVGQGYRAPNEVNTSVVALDARTKALAWDRPLPDGSEPEPYGKAIVTEEEVVVPTRYGIARYRVRDGADLPFVGMEAVGDDRRLLRAYERPFGNLIPVPGRGVLALDGTTLAFWASR